jgi:hypothetical protein
VVARNPEVELKLTSLRAKGKGKRAGATLVVLEPGPTVPLHGAKANEEPKGNRPALEDAAVVEKPPTLPDELISNNGRRGENNALELNVMDPVNNGAADGNGVICCVPAEEVLNELKLLPLRAKGKGEEPNAEETDGNPKTFDVLAVAGAEIPGKEKKGAEEILGELKPSPLRAKGESETPDTDEKEGNPVAFVKPVSKDREVTGEENKEAAAALLEKPKTEDAAAALKSREFGEPFGASAMTEEDASPALPAFDDRLPFCRARGGFAARR